MSIKQEGPTDFRIVSAPVKITFCCPHCGEKLKSRGAMLMSLKAGSVHGSPLIARNAGNLLNWGKWSMTKMLSDYQLDSAAFEMWLQSENGDNLADLDRAKRMLPIVLEECVTPIQKEYILDYYVGQMSVREIAEMRSVNPATVSRTIRRGLDKAYGYLRFVSPLFIKKQKKRVPLRNGRKRRRKTHKPEEGTT